MPTIQLPQLVTAVEVQPSTYDPIERTVEVVWATGQRAIRDPYPHDEPFAEELGMGAHEVNLERLNNGGAVLDSHGRPTHKPDGQPGLADQIGVVERAWVAGGQGHALIRFGVRDQIAWIRDEVAAGTFRNLSMKYIVHKMIDTGQFDLELAPIPLPILRATSWTPLEISLLPVPADFGTEVRSLTGAVASPAVPESAPASYPCELTQPPKPTGTSAMKTPNAPTPASPSETPATSPVASDGGTAPTPTPAAVAEYAAHTQPAVAAPAPARAPAPAAAPAAQPTAIDERNRIAHIYRGVQTLPIGTSESGRAQFAQHHIDAGTELGEFRTLLLDRLVDAPAQAPIAPQVQVTREGEGDRFRGLEESILHRCDPAKYKVTEAARAFVGMPLLRVAEELLHIHGVKIASRAPRALANQALGFRASLTTSDFPNLLANVANKVMQDAYEMTTRTYQSWTRRRTISDFKTVTSLILHGGSALEAVPEDAEIKRGTISESAETWSLSEYAKIWALSRKAVINDDLSAFDDLPRRFASQAANLESTVVYALLIANANMSDGNALFDNTNHGNDTGTTALATAGVGTVRAKMQRQTDADGNRITAIPRHLIVPPELETDAAQMNAGIVQPSAEASANVWRGSFQSIQTEPRLTDATQWYLAADPMQAGGIEYGFLAGENGPMVETREGWDVLGTEIRVVHSFGAGVVDWRGLQRVDTT